MKEIKAYIHIRWHTTFICQSDLLIFCVFFLGAWQSSILAVMNALCQDILPEKIIQLDKPHSRSRSGAFNLQSFKTHSASVFVGMVLLLPTEEGIVVIWSSPVASSFTWAISTPKQCVFISSLDNTHTQWARVQSVLLLVFTGHYDYHQRSSSTWTYSAASSNETSVVLNPSDL